MSRHLLFLIAALALAAPASSSAQSTTERERAAERREQERERVEREREKVAERREREREQAIERAERERERREGERERAMERVERERERVEERRERESAGTLDTTVAFDAKGTVNISCAGGEVVVTGSTRNEIRVRARTERGTIRFSSTGSTATLQPTSGRGCSDAHFEVMVPTGVHLIVSSWSGEVRVKGVHGEIEAQTQSGDIEVRDAGERVELQSLSGEINAQGVRGDASIHSLSGDVTLTGARGTVELETVSGDIHMRDIASSRVRTNSTSGDLTFSGSVSNGGRYEFTTHSGELRLELPSNVGAQLSLSTFSGEIDSAFPITLKAGEHGIGAAEAKKLSFSLGQGTARIVAETFSGDVTLTTTRGRP